MRIDEWAGERVDRQIHDVIHTVEDRLGDVNLPSILGIEREERQARVKDVLGAEDYIEGNSGVNGLIGGIDVPGGAVEGNSE